MRIDDLDAVERRAYKRFNQDGLWDMYLGVLLAMFGFSEFLDDALASETAILAAWASLVFGAVLVFTLLKKYVTAPRLGTFKPGPVRRSKLHRTRLVLAGSVVVGLVAWIVTAAYVGGELDAGIPMHVVIPSVWALNALVVFGLMAHFMDYPRLYAWSVLFAVTLPLQVWLPRFTALEPTPLLTFGLPGAVMISVGAVLFARFVKENPLPGKGVGIGADHS